MRSKRCLPTGIFYAQGVKANVLLTQSLPLIRAVAQRCALSMSLGPRRLHSSTATRVKGMPARQRTSKSKAANRHGLGRQKPWTSKLWIYDLRTNLHFTLKENTLKRSDLDDFVNCYFGGTSFRTSPDPQKQVPPGNRHDRKPTWTEKNDKGRWRAYDYGELIKRDKAFRRAFKGES